MIYKWIPIIFEDRCTGCNLCVEACGPRCLEIVSGIAVLVRPDHCGSEGHCVTVCPENVIEMKWAAMEGDRNVGRWTENPATAGQGT